MPWWEDKEKSGTVDIPKTAVAYYRHSAQIGQENSVEIQQDNVQAFAKKHGLTIIHEFADRGKSGLNAEGRPAFNEMMEWVSTRDDFQFILVLDVTRWGRFQDMDLSAHYESLCTQHGKQVIYTHIGMPKDEDLLINHLRKSIDRYQSAEYSRALSKKVFEGCVKVVTQGYRAGGSAPYGFHRLMLDEKKEPHHLLYPGQSKSIQNGRVVLVPGEENQVQTVQEIFLLFVEKQYDERQIAGLLNSKGIPSPGGVKWSGGSVRHVLENEQYAGSAVYNKSTQRLKTKPRRNPKDQWIVTPGAYDSIVDPSLFERARTILKERRKVHSREEMLERLKALYDKYGILTDKLLQHDKSSPSPSTYASHFGSMTKSFQQLFEQRSTQVRQTIIDEITQASGSVVEYDDFLIIDDLVSVFIQPSFPVPSGFSSYWPFWPDRRSAVDITLGVALSDAESLDVLGYIALPRLMIRDRWVKLSGASQSRLDLQGYNGLDFVLNLTGREGVK